MRHDNDKIKTDDFINLVRSNIIIIDKTEIFHYIAIDSTKPYNKQMLYNPIILIDNNKLILSNVNIELNITLSNKYMQYVTSHDNRSEYIFTLSKNNKVELILYCTWERRRNISIVENINELINYDL